VIDIQLKENGAHVQIARNGISHWKHLTIAELIKCINESVGEKAEEEAIASPLLPPGAIGHIMYPEENRYTVFMYREARLNEITFESRKYIVGHPDTIYRFHIADERLVSVYLWAVKAKVLRPESPVFRYPFFNTYLDGRICLGANHLKVNEPWQLYRMPEVISSLPGTWALSAPNRSGLEGDSLLKAIEGKPFPEEWLIPTEQKLKDILKI